MPFTTSNNTFTIICRYFSLLSSCCFKWARQVEKTTSANYYPPGPGSGYAIFLLSRAWHVNEPATIPHHVAEPLKPKEVSTCRVWKVCLLLLALCHKGSGIKISEIVGVPQIPSITCFLFLFNFNFNDSFTCYDC